MRNVKFNLGLICFAVLSFLVPSVCSASQFSHQFSHTYDEHLYSNRIMRANHAKDNFMIMTDLQLESRSYYIDVIFKKLHEQDCVGLYPQKSLNCNAKIRQLRFLCPKHRHWNENMGKYLLYECPYAELVQLANA